MQPFYHGSCHALQAHKKTGIKQEVAMRFFYNKKYSIEKSIKIKKLNNKTTCFIAILLYTYSKKSCVALWETRGMDINLNIIGRKDEQAELRR
jgi:hypothetical protein